MAKWSDYLIRLSVTAMIFSVSGIAMASSGSGPDIEAEIGQTLAYWTVIPFGILLLCIAILPLVFEHWWESNLHKGYVAAGLGLPMLLYFLFSIDHGGHALLTIAHEYYSFIVLLFALFCISGGIFLKGDLRPTPATNTGFLAFGSLIASFVGTTGAAMLLIRPLLKANTERQHTVHIYVFFIFLVANIGGSLLPIGDPPLFMGFLRGVPFFWTLGLWSYWLSVVLILLAVFFAWDSIAYRREPELRRFRAFKAKEPIQILGKHNFFLLLGVIGSVIFIRDYEGLPLQWLREPIMIGLALISLYVDRVKKKKHPEKRTPRDRNYFTFFAITEVAVLFAGIFVTMLPALCLLKANGSQLGVTEPWQFFWMTGTLSSFLDNAPTYMTFFSLAQGLHSTTDLVAATGVSNSILVAISCGAVFMGAMTYIGNAPNFMVKTIVEEAGARVPSFLGYMLYSVLILVPIFAGLTLLFFI